MASRAYYSATLVAVRHLYILGRQLGLLNQSRPRGFDSETKRFRRVPSRRTSKRRIFSQFLVFRLGARRTYGAGFLFEPKRKTILLRAVNELRTQRWVIPNGFIVRNLLFGRQASSPCTRPKWELPHVQNMWKPCGMLALTGFSAALYVCKVSRTVGFAFVRVRLD